MRLLKIINDKIAEFKFGHNYIFLKEKLISPEDQRWSYLIDKQKVRVQLSGLGYCMVEKLPTDTNREALSSWSDKSLSRYIGRDYGVYPSWCVEIE